MINYFKVRSAHAIVAYQGKILLLLRDDIPSIPNPNTWSLPGGEIEKGESDLEALIRELYEEANISVSEGGKRIQFLMDKPAGNGSLFFVQLQKSDADQIKLGNEGQELQFFEAEELKKLNLGGRTITKYFNKFFPILKELLEKTKTP